LPVATAPLRAPPPPAAPALPSPPAFEEIRPEMDDGPDGLTHGALAAVVISVVAAVILIVGLSVYLILLYLRKPAERGKAYAPTVLPPTFVGQRAGSSPESAASGLSQLGSSHKNTALLSAAAMSLVLEARRVSGRAQESVSGLPSYLRPPA